MARADTWNADTLLYDDFDSAKAIYEQGDVETAADVCCTLVGNVLCPRLLRVWAWQLRSICMSE